MDDLFSQLEQEIDNVVNKAKPGNKYGSGVISGAPRHAPPALEPPTKRRRTNQTKKSVASTGPPLGILGIAKIKNRTRKPAKKKMVPRALSSASRVTKTAPAKIVQRPTPQTHPLLPAPPPPRPQVTRHDDLQRAINASSNVNTQVPMAIPSYNPNTHYAVPTSSGVSIVPCVPDLTPGGGRFESKPIEPIMVPVLSQFTSVLPAEIPSITTMMTKKKKKVKRIAPTALHPKQLRSAAGATWVDRTMTDWPDDDFRIFVGDIGNEVSDAMLSSVFSKYKSFAKARVVRDRHNGKSRGYGFVSFTEADDFLRAFKEMNNKYVGSRPIKLQKSKWKDRQKKVKHFIKGCTPSKSARRCPQGYD